MKHKVAELEGPLLNAAVAKAHGWRRGRLGLPPDLAPNERALLRWFDDPDGDRWASSGDWPGTTRIDEFWPSSEWKDGGPIIERERIALFPGHGDAQPLHFGWTAALTNEDTGDYLDDWIGETPLIAAMRALVAAKFGEEVELP